MSLTPGGWPVLRPGRTSGDQGCGVDRPDIERGEALSFGIVTRIVEPDDLDATALEMARTIAAAPPIAVKLARSVIDELWRDRAEQSVRQELLSQVACFATEDYREAKAARQEGRTPGFVGR